jgi:hypothetical protein
MLLATAAVVVLAGFGIYLASGGLSEGVPTTTAGVATTIASPASTVAADSTLRQLVPGFQGRLRGVQTADNLPFAWTWSSGETAARLIPLPGGALGSWDASLNSLAVIAESAFGHSLYYGPATDVREVHNGVESFAWHSSQTDSVAWLSIPQADGMRELWRSLPPSAAGTRAFSASLVTRLDVEAVLVGYDDFGYALAVTPPSADGPVQLVTYDPEGNFIAEASGAFADSAGDRLLLLISLQSADPRLAIAGPGLGEFEAVGPDSAVGGLFSPNAKWVAAVAIEPTGAVLSISRPDLDVAPAAEDGGGADAIPLGVDSALPVSWSSDGRWILLLGGWNEPAASTGTLLLFVDTGSQRVYPVPAPGTVTGLSIQATGTPGPTRYFVP